MTTFKLRDIEIFNDFVGLKEELEGVYKHFASCFLKMFWLESSKRFPEINQFISKKEYRYNDEFYELENNYKINDIYYYYVGFVRKPYYENQDGEEAEEHIVEFIEFWEAHKGIFESFYGNLYEFKLGDGVESVSRFEIPNYVLERY